MPDANLDWLDAEDLDPERTPFGHARQELRVAEEIFHPDMRNEVLLRLFVFVKNRSEENPIWEVLDAQTTDLLLTRMYGGPAARLLKHDAGFDPEDHVKALAAIRAHELTSSELLVYYRVALTSCKAVGFMPEDSSHLAAWRAIAPLIQQQILQRMRAGLKMVGKGRLTPSAVNDS